jgi:CRISPR system Cascade subunit CasE
MYFSKIELSKSLLSPKGELDLYTEHQFIWDLLPEDKNAKRDFLYRRCESKNQLIYYLLSERKPENMPDDVKLKSQLYEPRLAEGDRLFFDLRVNAVRTIKDAGVGKQRKRRDVIESRIDHYKKIYPNPKDRPSNHFIHCEAGFMWLNQQAEKYGFTVKSTEVSVENHQFHKVRKNGDPNVKQFTSCDIQGQLQIVQPDKFIKNVLFNGLGRAKAFGCGLMLVRKI